MPAQRGSRGKPVFVLHEHQKPQHHFDLRLEEDGVLRSWAVPRGLPTTPGKDRLAVPVDDHGLEHATYEDETKSIADTGWWELPVWVADGPTVQTVREHRHPSGEPMQHRAPLTAVANGRARKAGGAA